MLAGRERKLLEMIALIRREDHVGELLHMV